MTRARARRRCTPRGAVGCARSAGTRCAPGRASEGSQRPAPVRSKRRDVPYRGPIQCSASTRMSGRCTQALCRVALRKKTMRSGSKRDKARCERMSSAARTVAPGPPSEARATRPKSVATRTLWARSGLQGARATGVSLPRPAARFSTFQHSRVREGWVATKKTASKNRG